MNMISEMKLVFEHLKNAHNLKPKQIHERLEVTSDYFNNAMRKGSHGTKTELVNKMKIIFEKEMEDFGQPKSEVMNGKDYENFLKEQIEFYKTENARLREDNKLLLNKLLEK